MKTRRNIEKLIDHTINEQYRALVRMPAGADVTIDEILRAVNADPKYSKHIAAISGGFWEDEIIWGRFVKDGIAKALREAIGFRGTRKWESVPQPGKRARKWVPASNMLLYQVKRTAAAKVRAGASVMAEGRYLQQLAIECEARGITDQQSISSVYEDAASAAVQWAKAAS